MTLVVDASALAAALLDPTDAGRELRRRLAGEVCHAPHLIDAEVASVLRRRVLRGELAPATAEALLAAAPALIDHRHTMSGALGRAAWALRAPASHYDALYVALAAALDVPLLTADERLGHTAALPCAVEPAIVRRPPEPIAAPPRARLPQRRSA